MLRVAAIQYCASDNAKDTLAHIQPLIAEAASRATLVTLPECASYLAKHKLNINPHYNKVDFNSYYLKLRKDSGYSFLKFL